MKKILLFLAVCSSPFLAHASTCSILPANPTSAQITSALASCGAGNVVQGVAGTTTLSSGATIVIPCGVQLEGPMVGAPMVVTGNTEQYEFTINQACTSTSSTGFGYIKTAGGLPLYVAAVNTGNISVFNNLFTDMVTTDDGSEDGAIRFDNNASGTTINGALIQNNVFGDANSCVATSTDVNPSTTGEDGCGIEIFGGGVNHIVNLVVKNNVFNHINEALHIYGTPYVVGNQGNTIDGGDIEGNLFTQVHRITIEIQSGVVNHPLVIKNNVFSNPLNGYYATYAISVPCCQYGNTIGTVTSVSPALEISGNIIYSNAGQFEWGLEYWGNGSTATNNLLQGNLCVGFEFGYPGATPPSVTNNTMQGPVMAGGACSDYPGNGAFIAPEFNGSYWGGATTPNVTGATPVSYPSVAPTIAPASGAQTYPLTVTLTDPGYTTGSIPLANTEIWYTTDGTTPVPGSGTAQYATSGSTITLAAPATVKAVGMWGNSIQPTSYPAGYGFTPSVVVSTVYSGSTPVVVTPPVVVPPVVVTPPVVTCTVSKSGSSLTLTCPGVTIQ